jgi:partner of Y14 and mago protein
MSGVSKAGIETTADGASYIPSSKRPDGSTRKEIRVRPGYRPPEDVETYKNRSAEAWKNRGNGGVPGAGPPTTTKDEGPAKSKNAKRREAARKKAEATDTPENGLAAALQNASLADVEKRKEDWRDPTKLATGQQNPSNDEEEDRQKKIRNQLKRLKAVRELKDKKAAGEKLSHDQLMKIGKEGEILRDLKKLGYDGPELQSETSEARDVQSDVPG